MLLGQALAHLSAVRVGFRAPRAGVAGFWLLGFGLKPRCWFWASRGSPIALIYDESQKVQEVRTFDCDNYYRWRSWRAYTVIIILRTAIVMTTAELEILPSLHRVEQQLQPTSAECCYGEGLALGRFRLSESGFRTPCCFASRPSTSEKCLPACISVPA